jgi:hypothetical protein
MLGVDLAASESDEATYEDGVVSVGDSATTASKMKLISLAVAVSAATVRKEGLDTET